MKRILIISVITAICLPAFGQTADTLVQQGRTLLTAKNLTNANSRFAVAVAISPNDPNANTLYAATRLLSWTYRQPVQAMMDRLGVSQTNRDIYHWTAKLARDPYGALIPPNRLNAMELVALARTNFLPEVVAAEANLAKVTDPSFILNLASNETSIGSVTVDFGDIQMLRTLLHSAEFLIYTINSYNFDAQLAGLSALYSRGEFTIENILGNYPQALTFATTSDLAAAKTAFANAVDRYLVASQIIRSRPTNIVRLFNYDPEMATKETKFRQTLVELKSSLNGPVALTFITNKVGNHLSVGLSRAFDGSVPLRSMFPRFAGNGIVLGSLPDPTFNGLAFGLNGSDVFSFLGSRFTLLPSFQTFQRLKDGKLQWSLNAAEGHRYAIETSTNLSTWTQLALTTATDAFVRFADPDSSTRRFYRVRDVFESVSLVDTAPTDILGSEAYAFVTLAGTSSNADGIGRRAGFNRPGGVAVDSAGNVYVADEGNFTIRKITPAGVVSTLAGSLGSPGSADGTGSDARFCDPSGVAVDNAGNVYVADMWNRTIRKISPSGVVVTLAGLAGNVGSADGTGSDARFCEPNNVAVDRTGNVYVADPGNYTIRKITAGGVVSTLAGMADKPGGVNNTGSNARFSLPWGLAVDDAGNVYVADHGNGTIRKITQAGVVSTFAGALGSSGSKDGIGSKAQFSDPSGVAVDGAGIVYVADTGNNTIRKITPAGVVMTLAGLAGYNGSADGTGNNSRFNGPRGVAVDSAGNVYVADSNNNTIRKIYPAGVVITLAGIPDNPGGADGSGSNARFDGPYGVAVDSTGNVYVADSNNNTIRKITAGGVVSTLAGALGSAGSADGTGSNARFYYPYGVAVDDAGNVYVADIRNNTIRKITPAGVVMTLAGLAGNPGRADGVGSNARFTLPGGLAVNGEGYVYVADTGNNTIRKITPAGVVMTLAGLAGYNGSADGTGNNSRFNGPRGVAVDSAGNVYVADSNNKTIRKIYSAGVVSTLVGVAGNAGITDGIGSNARFSYPNGVAVDSTGNVYVADGGNSTIRKITPAGVVMTLAGLAANVGSDDGTGSNARFNGPFGVAVDGAGNVYVTDTRNNTIRKGTPSSGGNSPPSFVPCRATATASVVMGFVVEANITDGGCDYTNPPVVEIVGGGGAGAMAVASISDGVVVRLTIIDAGRNYTSTPSVLITSPP